MARALVRSVPQDTDAALVPLARSVGYHIRQLAESWQAAMDREAAAHGVTVTQWRYLRELWEEDGPTVGALTQRVGRQGPTTVVAVQLLAREGLVTVVTAATDRRKRLVRLTPRGKKMAAKMAPLIRDVNEQAMSDLDAADVRRFKQIIVRIQRRLDRDDAERNEWAARRTQHLAAEVGL
jgi:DNA-binding MarR family transcriptional regulator